MKKNRIIALFVFLLTGIILPFKALAVCPLCTIAVGAGIGLSRYLGVDDVISGIWIGGLVISLIFWTLDWLGKKNIKSRLLPIIITVIMYAITVIPLKTMNIIGHPLNTLFCGVDRLIFGIGVGSLVFLISVFLNNWLKKKNNGKVYFPYQKMVIPVSSLLIASVVAYLIITC
ncbi:MAG: hypothetical protein V1905_01560 [bacterium]